jgi:hypothetical protein
MRLEDAGVIWTDPNTCKPLDNVKILFKYDALNGQPVNFEILDADRRLYFQATVRSQCGQAEIQINPGGVPGVHYIIARVQKSATETYCRYGSFRVEARTQIESDNPKVDELLKLLEEGLKLAVDIVQVNGKPVTYIKVGDNTWDNLAYPAFAVSAMRYFIRDMKTMFEAVFEYQWPNGRLPDHVYGDADPGWEGHRRIRSMMADLESGMVSTLYQGWVAHGDDEWAKKLLPQLEAAMEFVTTDPLMFDKAYGLIRRPHTMDEWDYQLGDGSCFVNENSRFVVMQGDASSMYEACGRLAELYEDFGNLPRALHWHRKQQHYYETGNRVFWDGVKYRHHVHLDPVDHGSFNEDHQLTMSNSWAITRKFADHEKAVSILKEYLRRWKETGDRFPWWTLQPGYPDEKTYEQGVYANGGLFPWIGGELCRGAFEHGMEATAYSMLLDFYSVIKRDHGGVFTWYDREGNAGVASSAQTNYDAWGIQTWTQAVMEGLVGVRSEGKVFDQVLCCPRWPAAEIRRVFVTAHFPASDRYFSYRYQANEDHIELVFTGTGKHVSFRVLLPTWDEDKKRKIVVLLNEQPVPFEQETIETSSYVIVSAPICGVQTLLILK